MADPAFSDFTELTALWGRISRRSQARDTAAPLIFNQMAVALAARLPAGPGPLDELQALAAAIEGRGFLPPGTAAPITGHQPGDRIALSAESFGRLAEACRRAL